MERDRPRPRGDSPEELLASAGVALCPYCKGALVDGTLAGACEGCNTLHHVSCFAEHRGCSTHGCASTHARSLKVGSPPPVDFPALSCALCKRAVEPDALIAQCACGRVLDTQCFETIGNCGGPGCKRPVRLLGHAEAVATRHRFMARVYWIATLLALGSATTLGLVAKFVQTKPGGDRNMLIVGAVILTILTLLSTKLAWGQRRRAVALEQLPPPRRPGEGRDRGGKPS